MQVWPRARNLLGECGPHQMRAVIVHVHGREIDIEELYVSSLHRTRDYTFPWNVRALLARHGIRSRWLIWWRGSFIKHLKRSLAHGRPVLIVIRSIQGTGCLHWISAWGYDAATDEFLCYDSQVESATSPHGNVRYSPAQLLASLPWRGTSVIEITR
jgi:hypothetical protein